LEVRFSSYADEDYQYWVDTDRASLDRVNKLIDAICDAPFEGIGKPEPLKGDLQGWWSRRITNEHRIIYRVSGKPGEQVLDIAACRKHY
jgi:toxin YoeB